jgi:hypothetical protein
MAADTWVRFFISTAVVIFSSQQAIAIQSCEVNMPATNPASDFTFLVGGYVRHNVTGLSWSRCYLGQDFSDNGSPNNYTDDSCIGNASLYTWQAAFTAVNNLSGNDAGGRLPNVKELQSIIEYACFSPAINTAVFPEILSPPGNFTVWSSSPVLSETKQTWVVQFDTGGSEFIPLTSQAGIRLVK